MSRKKETALKKGRSNTARARLILSATTMPGTARLASPPRRKRVQSDWVGRKRNASY